MIALLTMSFFYKNVIPIRRAQPPTLAILEEVVRRKKDALESYRSCFPHIETESLEKKQAFNRFVAILVAELNKAERNLANFKASQ